MSVHWKDLWDKYSERERDALSQTPVPELLRAVENGRYGDYYNIWRVIAERSSLQEAGWVLFRVLNSDIDYLYRYHCAAALISLVGIKDIEAVDLSSSHDGVTDNIELVRELLIHRLGVGSDRG